MNMTHPITRENDRNSRGSTYSIEDADSLQKDNTVDEPGYYDFKKDMEDFKRKVDAKRDRFRNCLPVMAAIEDTSTKSKISDVAARVRSPSIIIAKLRAQRTRRRSTVVVAVGVMPIKHTWRKAANRFLHAQVSLL
jgi:hypothetical protein